MSADENADGESAHLSQLPRLRRLDLSWCGNYQAVGFYLHVVSFIYIGNALPFFVIFFLGGGGYSS